MGEIWRIGIAAGAGAALGVLAAGALARYRSAAVAAGPLGAVAAGVAAWFVFDWKAAVAGVVGGLLGGAGAAAFAQGALRRGGTAGGTGVLLGGAAVVVFLLALIPLVGFLEAVAVPALAARARRRAGEKYAGLRTLAK